MCDIKRCYVFAVKTSGEDVLELAHGRCGRPIVLNTTMENEINEFLTKLRHAGGIVNRSIVIASAKGVVSVRDPTLLHENDGPLCLERGWE